jgi:predicted aldo/keto reductase-like oxidoreductase
MTREEAKSCIGTIEMLQRLAYNIHGVMDVIDADNCKKIIKALEQEPVLDKIRAEIENHCGLEKENHCRYCSYCNNLMGIREILEIIDKYKAESEE